MPQTAEAVHGHSIKLEYSQAQVSAEAPQTATTFASQVTQLSSVKIPSELPLKATPISGTLELTTGPERVTGFKLRLLTEEASMNLIHTVLSSVESRQLISEWVQKEFQQKGRKLDQAAVLNIVDQMEVVSEQTAKKDTQKLKAATMVHAQLNVCMQYQPEALQTDITIKSESGKIFNQSVEIKRTLALEQVVQEVSGVKSLQVVGTKRSPEEQAAPQVGEIAPEKSFHETKFQAKVEQRATELDKPLQTETTASTSAERRLSIPFSQTLERETLGATVEEMPQGFRGNVLNVQQAEVAAFARPVEQADQVQITTETREKSPKMATVERKVETAVGMTPVMAQTIGERFTDKTETTEFLKQNQGETLLSENQEKLVAFSKTPLKPESAKVEQTAEQTLVATSQDLYVQTVSQPKDAAGYAHTLESECAVTQAIEKPVSFTLHKPTEDSASVSTTAQTVEMAEKSDIASQIHSKQPESAQMEQRVGDQLQVAEGGQIAAFETIPTQQRVSIVATKIASVVSTGGTVQIAPEILAKILVEESEMRRVVSELAEILQEEQVSHSSSDANLHHVQALIGHLMSAVRESASIEHVMPHMTTGLNLDEASVQRIASELIQAPSLQQVATEGGKATEARRPSQSRTAEEQNVPSSSEVSTVFGGEKLEKTKGEATAGRELATADIGESASHSLKPTQKQFKPEQSQVAGEKNVPTSSEVLPMLAGEKVDKAKSEATAGQQLSTAEIGETASHSLKPTQKQFKPEQSQTAGEQNVPTTSEVLSMMAGEKVEKAKGEALAGRELSTAELGEVASQTLKPTEQLVKPGQSQTAGEQNVPASSEVLSLMAGEKVDKAKGEATAGRELSKAELGEVASQAAKKELKPEKPVESKSAVSEKVVPSGSEVAQSGSFKREANESVQLLEGAVQQKAFGKEITTEIASGKAKEAAADVKQMEKVTLEKAKVTGKPTIMPPKIVKELKSAEVEKGQKVKFEVEVEGQPQQVHWYVNGLEVDRSKKFVPMVEQGYYSLYVMDIDQNDVGEVRFVAENETGKCSSTAVLEIGAAPTIHRKLVDVKVVEGQPAEFQLDYESKPESCTVTWYQVGLPNLKVQSSSFNHLLCHFSGS